MGLGALDPLAPLELPAPASVKAVGGEGRDKCTSFQETKEESACISEQIESQEILPVVPGSHR